jgi:hemoglobin/transferrin/lactoferrin receptor protein
MPSYGFHRFAKRRREGIGLSRPCTAALLLAVLAVLPAGLFARTATEKADEQSYAIAPGPLEQALEQFARRSGINLSYNTTLLKNVETTGLMGDFTVGEGLDALLDGTGVMAEQYPAGWLLRRRPLPSPSTGVRSGTENESENEVPDTVAFPSLRVRDSMAAEREIPLEPARPSLALDVSDLLSATPLVNVSGGGRNAHRIYLRGIESTNLNITIDGARQGRVLFQHHGGVGGVDPDMLKRVEIQTGASADSGPGALGGSLHFETVDAQDLLQEGQTTGTRLKLLYGSTDETLRGSVSVYGLLRRHLGILAHMSGADRQDYENGHGETVLNTAGKDRDYLFKLSLLDLAGHSLRAGAEKNTHTADANWSGQGSDMGAATNTENAVSQKTERTTHTLEHRLQPEGFPLVNWRINLYHNENRLKNREANNAVINSALGGALKNTAAFELGPTAHRLTASMDYSREEGTYDTAGEKSANDNSTFGLALQEKMEIGRVNLTIGARYDDYNAAYGPDNISGEKISPGFRADAELVPGLWGFAGYSEAVRGSSIIPVQWLAIVSDDVVINHGKAVEPEKSIQREGGIRYRRSDLILPEDALAVEATFFDIRLTNTLEVEAGGRQGTPITAIYNNPETLRSRGYEIGLHWKYSQLDIRMAFSSFKTEDSNGNPVGIIRRKTGATGDQLTWNTRWRPRSNLSFGYTLNVVAGLTEVPEGDNRRPGYTLHGIQASWQPQWMPRATLSLAVDNLLDTYYCRQTSIEGDNGAAEEPGRDIRMSMTYSF